MWALQQQRLDLTRLFSRVDFLAQGRPSDWLHLYAAARFSCVCFSRSGPRVPAGTRPSLRPLGQEGGITRQSSGERAARTRSRVCGYTLPVIARLDRAIQYSETVMIEPRSRGVLDSPLSRGMTVVLGGRSCRLIRRHCERSEAIQSAAAEGFWIASAFAKASADKSLRSQRRWGESGGGAPF